MFLILYQIMKRNRQIKYLFYTIITKSITSFMFPTKQRRGFNFNLCSFILEEKKYKVVYNVNLYLMWVLVLNLEKNYTFITRNC